MSGLRYLAFELGEGDENVTSIEAVAATSADQHDAVMAEVRRVLDWARTRFPNAHGPIEEGMEWDHDLQVHAEGGWYTVALTLVGTPGFAAEFSAAFGEALL